ncbi:Na+/H+ antiporter NhaD/arsenite permease-like protein [Pseudomonas sp. PvP001]|jgi:arsenical pump membrane protein
MVVSNLVNIVSADFFRIGFAEYASVMWPVNIVSVMATLFMLWLCYRRDIPTTYNPQQLHAPETVTRDKATFVAGWWALALLLVACSRWSRWGSPSVRWQPAAHSSFW